MRNRFILIIVVVLISLVMSGCTCPCSAEKSQANRIGLCPPPPASTCSLRCSQQPSVIQANAAATANTETVP